MRSRKKAAEASLLVSNHHLLFADLAARMDGTDPDEMAVLPPYSRIILDEAHHMESTATSLFSGLFSLPVLNRYLQRFGKHGSGLLHRIAEQHPDLAERLLDDVPRLVEVVRAEAENMNALGLSLLGDSLPKRLKGLPNDEERKRLLEPMEAARQALAQLSEKFSGIVKEMEGGDDFDNQGLAIEANLLLQSLHENQDLLDSFINRAEMNDQVFWLDTRRDSDGVDSLQCHRTPLSVSEAVNQALWTPYETVIGVSATLAIGGKFDYWRNSIGAVSLEDGVLEGIFPSPFDYSSRVLLGVPCDAPDPGNRAEWETYLAQAVGAALSCAGGHALVLFTSYDTLRNTLSRIRANFPDSCILAQGEDDRNRLLNQFRHDQASVLFATDSFWEGVDIPGDALRLVIITRLPFRPPTDPVSEARGEVIEAAGGNAFSAISLPSALIRFRQGFGRLMRHRSDCGAVLVLDPRIVRKRYGMLFIESLPPVTKSIQSTEKVIGELDSFLSRV